MEDNFLDYILNFIDGTEFALDRVILNPFLPPSHKE
jgi:hypothetical protein